MILTKTIDSIRQKKSTRILFFLAITLLCYFIIITFFAFVYYKTDAISTINESFQKDSLGIPIQNKIEFADAFYFSYVSFHTIGFGDIHPQNNFGKNILLIESIISLFFTSIFSGLLVYFLLKRPRNLLISDYIYIRLKKEKFYLSCKVGNKGNVIINLQCLLEAFYIKDNIRIRFYNDNIHIGALEQTYHFDINLTKPNNQKLFERLKIAVLQDKLLLIRVTFFGFDSITGDNVVISKTYKTKWIKFATRFKKTGDWSDNGDRINIDWKGFQSVEDFDNPEIKEKFKNYEPTLPNIAS